MSISTQAVTAALRYLHATGHVRAVDGQSAVWQDVISEDVPYAEGADLHPAVRTYVTTTTESWTTVTDVLPMIRRQALERRRASWCGKCDERTRHVIGDAVTRCPACHPLRGQPIVQIDHDTTPGSLARLELPTIGRNA